MLQRYRLLQDTLGGYPFELSEIPRWCVNWLCLFANVEEES